MTTVLAALLLASCAGLGGGAAAAADERPASETALAAAREAAGRWRLGPARARSGEHGPRVEADLLVDGVAVARVRLDPRTGAFLPRERRDARAAEPAGVDLAGVEAAARQALPGLGVGAWAWPTHHGRAWRVPVTFAGRVVATVKVDAARGRLLARDADEED
jgi:hypothetical protein